jgi:hypothetical protein
MDDLRIVRHGESQQTSPGNDRGLDSVHRLLAKIGGIGPPDMVDQPCVKVPFAEISLSTAVDNRAT